MNNLVFGKYIPVNSIIHKLDPRVKIMAMFAIIIAIFVPDSWLVYGFLAVVISFVVMLAKVKLTLILKTLKSTVFMMIFLLIVNCLTVKTGYMMFAVGTLEIYSDAVFNTLYIVVRLLLMIMVTTTLTATTKPLDLTLGIESLLSPLRIFHFPYHEVAMMISIALRFIPTIIEETMRIMNSQKSRGVDFEDGKLKEKITAILSLIIPLFTVAFQRAYELADAMEARGYVPDKQRTRYHVLKINVKDIIFLILANIVLAFSIASRFVL